MKTPSHLDTLVQTLHDKAVNCYVIDNPSGH